MKKFLYFLCIIIALASCSKSPENTYSIDYGKVKYRDIFDGHKGCEFFRNHLDYFPFRWTKSDTVVSTKVIEIQFNKDCVRSKTEVTLLIAGDDKVPFGGLEIVVDGKNCPNGIFTVVAADTLQELTIAFKVDPALGDTVLSGHVFASSDKLDIANDVAIDGATPISDWTIRQVIKLNWWYWLIWFVKLLIAVAVIYLLYRIIRELRGKKPDCGNDDDNKKKNQQKCKKKKHEERKVWIQTCWHNDLLLGFKVSKPKDVSEDDLNGHIWWNESEKAKALIFAKKMTAFVRFNYQKHHRIHFLPQPFEGKKYIWISVPNRTHVLEIKICESSNVKKENLRHCLYYPNTKVGIRHAEELLEKIEKFIEENYG